MLKTMETWNIYINNEDHISWHLPLLAQPGPLRLAIHWASFSPASFASRLAVTALLSAAPLAAPEIAEIRDSRHCAWALTTQVLTRRRYWATRPLSFFSISCFPVLRTRCATWLSAQVCMREWRFSEPSPHAPATYPWSSPYPWRRWTRGPVSPSLCHNAWHLKLFADVVTN